MLKKRYILLALLASSLIPAMSFADESSPTSSVITPTQPALPDNSACASPDDQGDDTGWLFQFAPYLWMLSANGTLDVRKYTTTFDIPFSQIWSNLAGAGEFHFEASNGPWSLMLDPSYLQLKDEKSLGFPLQDVDITSNIWLVDGGVFYTLAQGCIGEDQHISLELLGGGRYIGSHNTLDFDSGLSLSGSNNGITPIVGGRIKYDPTDNSHFWFRADYGGFNVNNIINTWQTAVGYAYSVTSYMDVGVAYRALGIDFRLTSNNSIDTRLYGPMVGLNFRF